MSAVVSMVEKTYAAQASAEAVSTLEEWLEKAKRGEITSVAIVGLAPTGETTSICSKCPHIQALLGGLEILQWRIVREMD